MESGLGPLFGTRSITGPILVQYVKWHGLKLYLVGEEHFTNGDKSQDIDSQVIEQFCKFSHQNKTRCYTELTATEMKYQVDTSDLESAHSPLCTYAHYIWKNRFPSSHRVKVADARKIAPYDLYLLISYPMTYAYLHYADDMFSHINKVRKYAKIAEKEIFKRVTTRVQAKTFLESLVLPDVNYPDWFLKLWKNINGSDVEPPAPLRDKMTILRSRSLPLYERLVDHIKGYY